MGTPQNYPAILAAIEKTSDPIVNHSLTYALIEIGDEEALLAFLADKSISAKSRIAVWVALDQLHSQKPRYANLVAELATADSAAARVLWWLMRRHPAAAEPLAAQVREMLLTERDFTPQQKELLWHAGWLVQQPAIQEAVLARLTEESSPERSRLTALQLIEQARLRDLPEAWVPVFSHRT